MKLLRALGAAFSMFSRLPMPPVRWQRGSLDSLLCAFPLVGAAVGLFWWGWLWLCAALGWGPALQSAGLTLLPVMVTGGIHLDGFCDTVDARASQAGRERRLEILKDPHLGAFAAMALACYLLAYFALCLELAPPLWGRALPLLALGLVLERCLAGYFILALPPARPDGLAQAFAGGPGCRRSRVLLLVWALLLSLGLAAIRPLPGLAMAAAAWATLLLCRRMALGEFGGVTGDLAGYFIQRCELTMLAALVVTAAML